VKNKKIVLVLVLFIGVCLLGVHFFKDFFTTPTGGDYRNITDIESSYHAEAEIAQALAQMKKSPEKATIIMHSNSGLRQIALTFDGLADSTSMQQILDLLKKHNMKATFFVDGMQTAEDPQTVVNIKKAGHKIENYSFSGMSKMETLPMERVVKDFSQAQKIIKVTTDQEPNLLKCNETQYTDLVLQAAKACGFNSVVKSDAFLNVKQIDSLLAANAFVGKLKSGSIVSIKLKPNIELIVNEPGKTDLRPAVDKQPGLKELPQEVELGEKETIAAVERLLIAIGKANYITTYVEDFPVDNSVQNPVKTTFLQNSIDHVKESIHYSFLINISSFLQEEFTALFVGRTAYAAESVNSEAQEIKMIPTTEPALSYTFGGLANEAVVNDVLTRLHRLGIKATFFVAEVEMRKYPETLRRIIENGHEIGIAIRPKDGESADETRSTILRDSKKLQEQFGMATNLVKQPWGAVTDTTKEVIFDLGYKLIGQSVNVVQNKHKDYTSADQVMAEIFGKSMLSLVRGQIVHFRMDYYANEHLVGDLAELIKQRKVDNIAYATFYDNPVNNSSNDSQYTIKPIGEILNNTRFIYRYPVDLANVPAHLKNNESKQVIDTHNFLSEASKRYIGNGDVNDSNNMLGFSKMDTRRLDKSGLIHTKDNVIFVTFDDWGTDASVNKILYVLRKHDVPATFFILTHNVLNNPNLLRTIAMQGHNIGDHSDKHKPMVVRDPKTGKQVYSQDKEEYVQELTTSYQKLLNITGDVSINGKPMLTKYFRPPTLAISKRGFEALFESGYEFIVSGSCNTNDYRAKSVSQLEKIIEDGVYTENGKVKKGAVLVLHMLDSAAYTAIALDILLTANEAKADSDPSKFKVGRLSDYLMDGYSQTNRESLK